MVLTRAVARAVARRHRRRPGRRDEAGASAIELVLYMPLLMIAILLAVQFCLTYLGVQAASAAAREGNRVARVTGSVADGTIKADEYARDLGKGVLESPQVSVQRIGDVMRTRVSGNAPRIIPLLPVTNVEETVEGPVEQFVEDTG